MTLDLDRALQAVERSRPAPERGRVTEVTGLVVRATVPGLRLGDLVEIARGGSDGSAGRGAEGPLIDGAPLRAEVVGFRGDEAVLLPLGEPRGIGPEAAVTPTGRPLEIACGDGLLGRVLDGLGVPIDGRPPPAAGSVAPWAVDRAAPDPLTRAKIDRPLATGVRALDAMCTLGEGQRVGLFAGSGVGKSTLLGQICRTTSADVSVVCLVGERGREVREFLDDALGPDGLARSVVVCATSDAPSLTRLKSAAVATAIAEWFRDQGRRVLLVMDSVTRFARAQREVGLAAGEPPARQGYPPSVFAALPRLLERTGCAARGSITAIYTVLVAGSDMDEPIADEVRGILDGHIVLDRALAARGHFPAIDVVTSLSRVMPAVTTAPHRAAAQRVRELVATFERQRELIALGAYQRGSDARIDDALARMPAIERFLRQDALERGSIDDTIAALARLG